MRRATQGGADATLTWHVGCCQVLPRHRVDAERWRMCDRVRRLSPFILDSCFLLHSTTYLPSFALSLFCPHLYVYRTVLLSTLPSLFVIGERYTSAWGIIPMCTTTTVAAHERTVNDNKRTTYIARHRHYAANLL